MITFDDFATRGLPVLEQAKAAVIALLADIRRGGCPRCLTLAGASGIGKTMLATIAWQQVAPYGGIAWRKIGDADDSGYYRPSNRDCCWADYRRLTDAIHQRQSGLPDAAESSWFAVIDDAFASHDPSGYIASRLDGILRGRRGWTIVTTNLLLPDIAKIEPRIASWLIRDGNKVIELEGVTDYSLALQAEQKP